MNSPAPWGSSVLTLSHCPQNVTTGADSTRCEAPEEGCWCAQERPPAAAAAGRGTCAGGVLLRQGRRKELTLSAKWYCILSQITLISETDTCVSSQTLTSQTTYMTKSKSIGPRMEGSRGKSHRDCQRTALSYSATHFLHSRRTGCVTSLV